MRGTQLESHPWVRALAFALSARCAQPSLTSLAAKSRAALAHLAALTSILHRAGIQGSEFGNEEGMGVQAVQMSTPHENCGADC